MHRLCGFKSSSMVKCFLLLSYCFLIACNGGSSSSPASNPSSSDINVSVSLPEESPLMGESLSLDVYDEQYSVNKPLGIIIENPTDAYLMLPQREGDLTPSVYLFSSLLPGETTVQINSEETAISLIMGAIPHSLLL